MSNWSFLGKVLFLGLIVFICALMWRTLVIPSDRESQLAAELAEIKNERQMEGLRDEYESQLSLVSDETDELRSRNARLLAEANELRNRNASLSSENFTYREENARILDDREKKERTERRQMFETRFRNVLLMQIKEATNNMVQAGQTVIAVQKDKQDFLELKKILREEFNATNAFARKGEEYYLAWMLKDERFAGYFSQYAELDIHDVYNDFINAVRERKAISSVRDTQMSANSLDQNTKLRRLNHTLSERKALLKKVTEQKEKYEDDLYKYYAQVRGTYHFVDSLGRSRTYYRRGSIIPRPEVETSTKELIRKKETEIANLQSEIYAKEAEQRAIQASKEYSERNDKVLAVAMDAGDIHGLAKTYEENTFGLVLSRMNSRIDELNLIANRSERLVLEYRKLLDQREYLEDSELEEYYTEIKKLQKSMRESAQLGEAVRIQEEMLGPTLKSVNPSSPSFRSN